MHGVAGRTVRPLQPLDSKLTRHRGGLDQLPSPATRLVPKAYSNAFEKESPSESAPDAPWVAGSSP